MCERFVNVTPVMRHSAAKGHKIMNGNDTRRLSRLTAILSQLPTKRLTTAISLAER